MQPYIFYLDARWGSFEALKILQEKGFGIVASLSSSAYPKCILSWLGQNLEKHQWRRIFHVATGARLVALRAKENKTLYLLTLRSTESRAPKKEISDGDLSRPFSELPR